MRVLYDPEPRATDHIFSGEDLAAFRGQYEVTEWVGQDRDAFYAAELPRTDILISQQPMGADRLALAPRPGRIDQRQHQYAGYTAALPLIVDGDGEFAVWAARPGDIACDADLDFVPDTSMTLQLPQLLVGPSSKWAYPVLVTSSNPSNGNVALKGMPYDARVYTYDSAPAPA